MKIPILSLVLIFMLLLMGCPPKNDVLENNKKIVRTYFELMDEGNSAFYDLLSTEYVVHFTGGVEIHGRDGRGRRAHRRLRALGRSDTNRGRNDLRGHPHRTEKSAGLCLGPRCGFILCGV